MELIILFLTDPIGLVAGFGVGYIISAIQKLKGM